jgi:hypothetical protein
VGDRAFPRFALEADVTVRHRDVAATGRTRNVSRGGLCAHVPSALPVGASITLEMALVFDENLTSDRLALPARVVWSTPIDDGHQIGLGFLALSPEQARYLDVFLRYLANSTPGRSNAESDHADLFSRQRDRKPSR